jgi:hypothetical protein
MSLKLLAAARHDEMAPHGSYRSQERIEFCNLVAEDAKTIAFDLIGKKHWGGIFDDEGDSQVRRQLLHAFLKDFKGNPTAARILICNLQKFQREDKNDPLLVVAFDEVSNLLAKHSQGLKRIRSWTLCRP